MPPVSRGRQANPVLTYETALRRFLRCTARWRIPMDGGCINGDGNSMTEATAEGRLYNHSPRLACLPGVSCGRINLPPKSGCINHGKYFSKLSQPSCHRWWRTSGTRDLKDAQNPGTHPLRSAYRVTEKCRRSATMPMWRWFSAFLQPLFGGSCVRRRCHGVGKPTPC